MTLSTKTLRERFKWDRSKSGKGYELMIKVVAYDNGVVHVNGLPNTSLGALAWLDANREICSGLGLFCGAMMKEQGVPRGLRKSAKKRRVVR